MSSDDELGRLAELAFGPAPSAAQGPVEAAGRPATRWTDLAEAGVGKPGAWTELFETAFGQESAGQGAGASSSAAGHADATSTMTQAREAVVQARIEHDRKVVFDASPESRRRIAEAFVGPSVDALQHQAIREGWSQDQLVARLSQLAEEVRAQPTARESGWKPGAVAPGSPGGGLRLQPKGQVRETMWKRVGL